MLKLAKFHLEKVKKEHDVNPEESKRKSKSKTTNYGSVQREQQKGGSLKRLKH